MVKNPMIDDIVTNNSNGGYNWDNFMGDLFTGGAVSQSEQNDWTRQFSEEQFAYQKWLNSMVMNREDTSIQRRVEDLKRAGLHPVLATGQGASAVSLSSGNSAQTLDGGFKNRLSVADLLSVMTATSQVNKTNAEAEYVKTMAENNSKKTAAEIKALGVDTSIKEYDFQKAMDNGLFYSKTGLAYEFANALDLMQNKNAFGTLQGIIEGQGLDKVASNIHDVVIPTIKSKVVDTVESLKTSKNIHSSILDKRVDKLWNKLDKRGKINFFDYLEAKSLYGRYQIDKIPVPEKLQKIIKYWDKNFEHLKFKK